MAYSDLELLARIVKCEAGGEGLNGMRAVASVVMNRVNITYGEYGRLHTVREVVREGEKDVTYGALAGLSLFMLVVGALGILL